MIKSRGYRIELDEIEIALSTLSSLLEFCIVPIPDVLWENKICAAVVLKEKEMLTENDIKKYCKQKIPLYMIPDEVIFMEMLPKTPSGKINKKAVAEIIQKRSSHKKNEI